MARKILIIEDNEALRKQIKWAIVGDFEIYEAGNKDEALKLIRKNPQLVLLDLHLPPEETTVKVGLEIFESIQTLLPQAQVIVITGERDRELAYELIERGVFDYLEKPVDMDELNIVIKRALYRLRLEEEISYLRREIYAREGFENLVGKSQRMLKVFEKIEKVAPTDANVLILGESGTGKELVARAIYRRSKRRVFPFIPVDCGAIPENLMESELFGYEKGAFTGAVRSKPGRLEEANRGTIFFDEIGNLPLPMQAKLLRFLETREIVRLGGRRTIKLDVRIISATNKNLEEMISKGEFREDLFYRLNTVIIKLPPLRERREDIEDLANYFLKKYATLYKRNIKGISERALEILKNYQWPGNVRELQHVIENAVIMGRDEFIEEGDLEIVSKEGKPRFPVDLKETLRKVEKELVEKALSKTGGNRKEAARLLGIDIYQLKYLIKKHGLL